jgi:CubicO group peptidase (beta-lactamase class C family)
VTPWATVQNVFVQRRGHSLTIAGHMWPGLPGPAAVLGDRALEAKLHALDATPDLLVEHRYVHAPPHVPIREAVSACAVRRAVMGSRHEAPRPPLLRHHLVRVDRLRTGCAREHSDSPPPTPIPTSTSTSTATATSTASPTPTAPEKLTADSPRTTATGSTFTAPSGFTVDANPTRTILTAPEGDLRVILSDWKVATADAAVAAAWGTSHPDFKRALKLASPRPAREGWDEIKDFTWETSPDEKMVVRGAARRHGDTWTVNLFEASEATFEKRIAALLLVRDSLHPAGYVKESFAGKKANALDAARIEAIRSMLDKARDNAGVPGVAFTLVQDGKVVFEGGLGVRELGKPEKVDKDTLFLIASNTKALTTLLLAELVDEKKFGWETPVKDVYPAFKLGDADTTSKVLVKHLVCACTGLPRQDMEWLFEFKSATPSSVMGLLGTFQPTTKFGETYQYSNLLAAAAGFVGGYVSAPKKELGAAYDEAMNARVFSPLGMRNTTFDYARALRGNHASPHSEDIDGKASVGSMDLNRAAIPVRPAGAAWSSASDLTKYVQLELAKGKLPNGKSLVTEESLLARRAPQVKIGAHITYGMGLEVDTEYGVGVVHHGGSLLGFKSDMFWIPEAGVGGVILTSADAGRLLEGPFIRKTLEVLYDGKPEAEEDLASSIATRKASIAKERPRRVLPPDPAIVAKLAKHYKNDALGEINVKTNGVSVVFDFGEWKSAVASRKNDDGTDEMVTIDPGVLGFEFVIAEKNGAHALVVRDAQHEYVFTEVK